MFLGFPKGLIYKAENCWQDLAENRLVCIEPFHLTSCTLLWKLFTSHFLWPRKVNGVSHWRAEELRRIECPSTRRWLWEWHSHSLISEASFCYGRLSFCPFVVSESGVCSTLSQRLSQALSSRLGQFISVMSFRTGGGITLSVNCKKLSFWQVRISRLWTFAQELPSGLKPNFPIQSPRTATMALKTFYL